MNSNLKNIDSIFSSIDILLNNYGCEINCSLNLTILPRSHQELAKITTNKYISSLNIALGIDKIIKENYSEMLI